MTQSLDPLVKKGSILVYRVFDIAEEVNLSAVESLLRQSKGPSRLIISQPVRHAMVIRNPPVRIQLGEMNLRLGTSFVRCEIFVTVWDYGAASLVFQIPVADGTSWSQLIRHAAVLNGDVSGTDEIDGVAKSKLREVVEAIKPAIKGGGDWHVFEDYVVYFLEGIHGFDRMTPFIEEGKLPELILGESQEKLAPKARSGILEYVFQYAETDLAAIDWNSAVVVEPASQRDIPDIIEFALTHLLEFRYYDDLLDSRLSSLYDSLKKQRRGLLRGDYREITEEANTMYIEISEFIERVDNSLKVVGDFYVAVIYRAAIRRFRIPDWEQSIARKMNLLARVSELLQGQVNVQRSHTLEIIIIILIAVEIISAVLKNIHS